MANDFVVEWLDHYGSYKSIKVKKSLSSCLEFISNHAPKVVKRTYLLKLEDIKRVSIHKDLVSTYTNKVTARVEYRNLEDENRPYVSEQLYIIRELVNDDEEVI